jgi:hypothetical protein
LIDAIAQHFYGAAFSVIAESGRAFSEWTLELLA